VYLTSPRLKAWTLPFAAVSSSISAACTEDFYTFDLNTSEVVELSFNGSAVTEVS